MLGFACIRCAGFKPFWPLTLVQQALTAIILAALRRFRGAALFHGPRPSSSQGAACWPSGLTIRRSRPPAAAAELRALEQAREIRIWIRHTGRCNVSHCYELAVLVGQYQEQDKWRRQKLFNGTSGSRNTDWARCPDAITIQ